MIPVDVFESALCYQIVLFSRLKETTDQSVMFNHPERNG